MAVVGFYLGAGDKQLALLNTGGVVAAGGQHGDVAFGDQAEVFGPTMKALETMVWTSSLLKRI